MSIENTDSSRRGALLGLGAGIVAMGLSSTAIAASHTNDMASLEAAVESLRSALVNGDGDVLKKILNDQMTYSHSDGRVWTKDVLLENIAGKKRYLSIATSNQTMYISGATGIVRHTYDVVNNDAKTSTSHIQALLCWTKTKQQWQLLARGSGTAPA
jgi:hypothetical protein